MKILFASTTEKPETWLPLLRQALPKDEITLAPSREIDVALVAAPPAGTFEKLGRPKLVQSLWMGVEKLLADPALPRDAPLARLVDPGMVAAMSETVLVHVLDWHRHLYAYRSDQQARRWRHIPQRLSSDRTVGLLGLGELGGDAALKLAGLGFNVAGFSRRPKFIAGVRCFTELEPMVSACDALVCLLPLTRETRGILSRRVFSSMKAGGCLINVARGAHLVTADLLAALREDDFSIRARGAAAGDSLGQVFLEVNSLVDTLRTERLGAQEATALLRAVMWEIDVAIFAFDSTGRLALVNRFAAELLGRPSDNLLGTSLADLGLGAAMSGARRKIDAALSNERRRVAETVVSEKLAACVRSSGVFCAMLRSISLIRSRTSCHCFRWWSLNEGVLA